MPAVVISVERMKARAHPLLARLPKESPLVVEVGVSTALLAEYILQRRSDLNYVGIDPWRGYHQQPADYVATGDVHAALSLAEAESNMRMAIARIRPFNRRATIMRRASPAAARAFDDGSINCVFLDGDHSASGVTADIEGWWPKIRSGGWLGGHDLNNRDPRFKFGVDEAVANFSAEIGIPFEADQGLTWWIAKP